MTTSSLTPEVAFAVTKRTSSEGSLLAERLTLEGARPGAGSRLGAWQLARALLGPGVRVAMKKALLAHAVKGLLGVASPAIVYGLLRWFGNPDVHVAWGCVWVAGLAAAEFGQPLCRKACEFHEAKAGGASQAAIAGCMLRSMLLLNAASMEQFKTGQLLNLLSTDAENIGEFWQGALLLTVQPLEIVAIACLFWLVVAEATLGAVAVCALSYCGVMALGRATERSNAAASGLADERLRLLSEVLYGMKVVKATGWAPRFQQRLHDLMHAESSHALTKKVWMGGVVLLTSEGVDVMAYTVCALAVLAFGQAPNSARLFSMWVIIGALHSRLFAFPEALRQVSTSWTSLRRCAAFLDAAGQEVCPGYGLQQLPAPSGDAAGAADGFSVRDGRFNFGRSSLRSVAVLEDVQLSLSSGRFYAVMGPVGSGKSCLLLALLGELRLPAQAALDRGPGAASVAYVPQDPIVFNDTVRNNVCFGLPFEEEWYKRVCQACALEHDLSLLSDGDATVIGSRGINVSGGQQSRICLARAAYARAAAYLLDDPLAKLDARVTSEVHCNLLLGLLKGHLRVVATSSASMAQSADCVLRVDDGSVAVDEHAKSTVGVAPGSAGGQRAEPAGPGWEDAGGGEDREAKDWDWGAMLASEDATKARGPWWRSLWFFLRHFAAGLGSRSGAAVYVLLMVLETILVQVAAWYLALWTDDPGAQEQTHGWYATFYGLWTAAEVVVATAKYLCLAVLTQRAVRQLQFQLLNSVLQASFLWLQKVPVGQILRLFSGSLGHIADRVYHTTELWLLNATFLLAVAIANCAMFPPFAIVLAILAVIIGLLLRGSFGATREKDGVEETAGTDTAALSRACLQHSSDTLLGLTSVRAFAGATVKFQGEFDYLLGQLSAAKLADSQADAQVQLHMGFVAAAAYSLGAITVLVARVTGGMTAGTAGFVISNSCFFTFIFSELAANSLILQDVAREREMLLSIARAAPREEIAGIERTQPAGWPSCGQLLIESLDLQYGPELPPVIKGLSLHVSAGEHLGIVGRTGSGKSSLLLAISRLVEPAAGRIFLDGVSICSVGLQELRGHFGVLSQDPLFFSGSVRENLDPFSEHSDGTLWQVLDDVGLTALLGEEGTARKVAELGGNFSAGERQLLCLARAALREPRVVLVDEATAALDTAADARVQGILESRFTHRGVTVLQVAHRLRSIAACGRVAVLEAGALAELGAPAALLAAPPAGGGLFRQLVASLGEQEEIVFRNALSSSKIGPKAGCVSVSVLIL